ncbi:MAG: sigma-70 family RNA polymerase sigma factor [Bacteroidetes bacterium]|nr:sigma-70 family RNA polymerase sigma factor [Bacteroidota bacterium]
MRTDRTEQDLLKGLAQNERESVETIYKQHYNMVQTMIVNNNGSIDDAKDIFQEALIVLYEKAKSGNFELSCQIKTYVYSVCRRLWLKRFHHLQKFAPETENMEDVIPVEEELETFDQKNKDFLLMESAMQNLGEPCKSLLESYYLKKRSMVEIAADFGYTNADNAKNQKYKCLMRLKKMFFEQYKK